MRRIVHLGFEVRIEVELANGGDCWAQVTRDEVDELELEPGARVYAVPAPRARFQLAGERQEREAVGQLKRADCGEPSARQVVYEWALICLFISQRSKR